MRVILWELKVSYLLCMEEPPSMEPVYSQGFFFFFFFFFEWTTRRRAAAGSASGSWIQSLLQAGEWAASGVLSIHSALQKVHAQLEVMHSWRSIDESWVFILSLYLRKTVATSFKTNTSGYILCWKVLSCQKSSLSHSLSLRVDIVQRFQRLLLSLYLPGPEI